MSGEPLYGGEHDGIEALFTDRAQYLEEFAATHADVGAYPMCCRVVEWEARPIPPVAFMLRSRTDWLLETVDGEWVRDDD